MKTSLTVLKKQFLMFLINVINIAAVQHRSPQEILQRLCATFLASLEVFKSKVAEDFYLAEVPNLKKSSLADILFHQYIYIYILFLNSWFIPSSTDVCNKVVDSLFVEVHGQKYGWRHRDDIHKHRATSPD